MPQEAARKAIAKEGNRRRSIRRREGECYVPDGGARTEGGETYKGYTIEQVPSGEWGIAEDKSRVFKNPEAVKRYIDGPAARSEGVGRGTPEKENKKREGKRYAAEVSHARASQKAALRMADEKREAESLTRALGSTSDADLAKNERVWGNAPQSESRTKVLAAIKQERQRRKGGARTEGVKPKGAQAYLGEKVNYGGIETTRGEMIADLERVAKAQFPDDPRQQRAVVERYMQGHAQGERRRARGARTEGPGLDPELFTPAARGARPNPAAPSAPSTGAAAPSRTRRSANSPPRSGATGRTSTSPPCPTCKRWAGWRR